VAIVAGCAAAALPGAPSALAATIRADTATPAIVYYGPSDPRTTRELIHLLDVTAGPTEERFWLGVSTDSGNSKWVGQFAGGDGSSGPVLEGPGRLGPARGGFAISATQTDRYSNSGRDRCPNPVSASRTSYYELTVPAGRSTTVVVKRRLALTHAPTDATLYRQDWTIAPAASSDPHPDLEGTASIFGPLPELAGLAPARLSLHVGISGSGRSITAGQHLAVRARRPLTLSGQLVPAQRGERITIWHYAPDAPKAPARQIASVRVDRHGRFLYRHWRPTAAGLHELFATYAGRREVVEPTRSACGGPKVTVR
jgi:hypothetical protein